MHIAFAHRLPVRSFSENKCRSIVITGLYTHGAEVGARRWRTKPNKRRHDEAKAKSSVDLHGAHEVRCERQSREEAVALHAVNGIKLGVGLLLLLITMI